jgi:hypothetical protein
MPLVHGCILTRGTKDLAKTAVFVGGSDLAAGEAVLAEVRKHLMPMFGLSVSVMLDSNGANTTAAAAVVAAGRHLELKTANALVLGGTGPVGQRVEVPTANVEAVATASSADGPAALDGCDLVVAAGAVGVTMLPTKHRIACDTLRVAIDLNGVPPAGIEGIELNDQATNRNDCWCYGAMGVGGTKMKIHKAAVKALFARNDAVLDIDQIYDLAKAFT